MENIKRIIERIIGTSISKKGFTFIKNLSYLTMGTFIASLITFFLNILVVRHLGPSEYGKFSLIITISNFFIVPMLVGMNTSAVKYLSEGGRQKEIISTAVWTSFTFTTVSCILLFFLRNILASLIKTDIQIVNYSIIFAVILTGFTLSNDILRGLHKIKTISILNIIKSIIIAAVLAMMLFILRDYTFKNPFYANTGGILLLVVITIIIIRKKLFFFNLNIAKKIGKYASYAIIGNISGLLLQNIDRLMINSMISISEVGLYSAYIMASGYIVNKILEIFTFVFFPAVSNVKDKRPILKIINRIYPYSLILITLTNIGIIKLLFLLYSEKYTFSILICILFAFNSGLNFVSNSYMWLLNAEGKTGIKNTVKASILVGLINLLLNLLLIPIIGIGGAITATVISNLIFIIYFKTKCKALFEK